MRKVFKTVFLPGAAALLAVTLSAGTASAVTEVTNVQPNADYQAGGTQIVVDAEITCEAAGDKVVFEAMQTQGRHIGVGVLEVTCSTTGTIDGPFTIDVFDGLKFRSGPFTLLVKTFDVNGVFLNGQGFQLKGK
ncbi:MAG TPA: hypothetical protein VNL14_19590 [Candidatus Acidoferrales bacterium]|nr:hypothetical protein [Candidatus Acidoferrales bacterium]